MDNSTGVCPLPTPKSTDSFWHTEPSPLLLGHRSTRKLPSYADVVVIGSGITGTSVAHHLLQDRGKRDGKAPSVLMLEAREACWGATGRNGGHCQPLLFEHPTDPAIAHFELRNFYAIEKICTNTNTTNRANPTPISCEFHRQPGVRALYSTADLSRTQSNIADLALRDPEMAKHMSIVIDPGELARLRVPTACGAVVTDTAARMWPYKFVAGILERLLVDSTDGVAGRFNLQTHTPVTGICPFAPDDDDEEVIDVGDAAVARWVVNTERGDVKAGKVVLATNAYTSHLLHGFADLIVPCRGEMSALVPPPSVSGENRLQTSFGFEGDAQDDYLIQRPNEKGGHLMYGGGRQFGLSIGNADDSTIEKESAKYLRRALVTLLGLPGDVEQELEAVKEWTGVMGFSRDNRPWVGQVPGMAGLYISAGYTGHGMPNTWLCGKAVAVMLEQSSVDGGIEAAVNETGLPESYVLTDARLEKARALATVEEQDHMGMFKAEST